MKKKEKKSAYPKEGQAISRRKFLAMTAGATPALSLSNVGAGL